MSYRFADSLRAWSCSQAVSNTCMTHTIAMFTVLNSWWWTEELSETCSVYPKNKFEKSVHLVGFIIRSFYLFWQEFLGGSQNYEKRTLAESCLSLRVGQLGFHGTDSHEICYLRIFRIYVEENQALLISDKSNGYFTWRPMHILISSLNSS